MALVHATAAIRFGANQVISVMAINIAFLGLPPLLSGALFASTRRRVTKAAARSCR